MPFPLRSLPLVTTLLLAALTALHADDGPKPKPNIIIHFIDDLGYGDIGPFGAVKQKTPNLDRMAREGMKLTSFYAAPVCSVSRAQILTGCYGARISVPAVYPPAAKNGLHPQEPTIADRLKPLGYATQCIGKWHLGDQPAFLPTKQGFDHYLGIPYSIRAASLCSGLRAAGRDRDRRALARRALRLRRFSGKWAAHQWCRRRHHTHCRARSCRASEILHDRCVHQLCHRSPGRIQRRGRRPANSQQNGKPGARSLSKAPFRRNDLHPTNEESQHCVPCLNLSCNQPPPVARGELLRGDMALPFGRPGTGNR